MPRVGGRAFMAEWCLWFSSCYFVFPLIIFLSER
jgi:hypothetical protein